MSTWQESNDVYLATALAWLRLKLEKLTWQEGYPEVTCEVPSGTEVQIQRGLFPDHESIEEKTQEAFEAVAEAEACQPALSILGKALGLSIFEKEVMLLCASMELDTLMPLLMARAQGDSSKVYPTFALAMAIFDNPAWDVLSPLRPLRRFNLLEIHRNGAQPLISCPLSIDERIMSYIKGLNYLDDRLMPFLIPVEGDARSDDLPPSQQSLSEVIVQHLHKSAAESDLPVIQLLGKDSSSKQLVAEHAAHALGLELCRVPAEFLPSQASDLETLARLWQRESLLLPIALYLDSSHLKDAGAEGYPSFVRRFISRISGPIFLDVRDPWEIPGKESLRLEVSKPTPDEQQKAWASALDPSAGEVPSLLAGQFDLSVSKIKGISTAVTSEETDRGFEERLWDECLSGTRPGLDALARRIDARATWDDIVLPAGETNTLRQIAAQVRYRSKVYDEWGFRRRMNRGLGISVLFAGDSGTGKTMAAEVLANELRLNLYRIDLSAVVSKYIGETEKNLRRLFDAAEDGGAILLFDEADALFGRRSEVKDSHDRYANIEVNYLLQRMEAYRGLAILATNMKGALDKAFLRRLRFIVSFPFPDASLRKAIWTKAFPSQVPISGMDYERLSRLSLTGGSIHNVALNSAFATAQRGEPVTMPVVMDAVRAELRKLEKPISEADLRWP